MTLAPLVAKPGTWAGPDALTLAVDAANGMQLWGIERMPGGGFHVAWHHYTGVGSFFAYWVFTRSIYAHSLRQSHAQEPPHEPL